MATLDATETDDGLPARIEPQEPQLPQSRTPGMQIVQSPAHFPGCCALSRSATGPFLDTGRTSDTGERIYFTLAMVDELIRAVGGVTQGEYDDVARQQVDASEALARVRAERDEAVAQLEELRSAVSYTLRKGGVEVKKPDPENPGRRVTELELRQVPGRPKPVIEETNA